MAKGKGGKTDLRVALAQNAIAARKAAQANRPTMQSRFYKVSGEDLDDLLNFLNGSNDWVEDKSAPARTYGTVVAQYTFTPDNAIDAPTTVSIRVNGYVSVNVVGDAELPGQDQWQIDEVAESRAAKNRAKARARKERAYKAGITALAGMEL